MAIPLVQQLRNPGDPVYYTKGWLNCVEDHLPFLQDQGNGTAYAPTGMERSRYRYRFYAFLRDVCKITDPSLFYVYLRANNMTSPDQFDDKYDLLILPDAGKVQAIYNRYQSSLA